MYRVAWKDWLKTDTATCTYTFSKDYKHMVWTNDKRSITLMIWSDKLKRLMETARQYYSVIKRWFEMMNWKQTVLFSCDVKKGFVMID